MPKTTGGATLLSSEDGEETERIFLDHFGSGDGGRGDGDHHLIVTSQILFGYFDWVKRKNQESIM